MTAPNEVETRAERCERVQKSEWNFVYLLCFIFRCTCHLLCTHPRKDISAAVRAASEMKENFHGKSAW